jgi:hypothetical protein
MSATNPDLTRFRARGGKILMYFGWADPALNPLMGIQYYEDVQRKMGPATRDFFRLYMMPGVFHCGGGTGPACFDPVANLIPWVEQDKAPERIVAAQMEGSRSVRTRPICPYPQVGMSARAVTTTLPALLALLPNSSSPKKKDPPLTWRALEINSYS